MAVKRYVIFLITGLIALGVWPAQAETLVAVGDSYCPYNCESDAAQRGYMVDILEKIVSPRWNLDYRLEPWTRAISLVESGKMQVLVGTARETGRKINLTDPLGQDRTCFFVRSDSQWHYKALADLQSVRLGVIQDYIYDANGPLDKLIAGYRTRKDARLEMAYGKDALASSLRKLVAHRSDVVVENENVGLYTIRQLGLGEALRMAGCASHYSGSLYLGIAPGFKDGATLRDTINQGIRRLRKSGELRDILAAYGVNDWDPAGRH